MYSYVGNDPLNKVDPTGTESAGWSVYGSSYDPCPRCDLNEVVPFGSALEEYEAGNVRTAAVLAGLDMASFGRGRIVSSIAVKLTGALRGSITNRTASALGKAVNAVTDHLTAADLSAAKRELSGEVVARRTDGTAYDHVMEVRNALGSVGNAIDRLKSELGSDTLTKSGREEIEGTISKLSKFKDNIESWLKN